MQRRSSRKPLANMVIKTEIVERHYQQRAIRRIAETFELTVFAKMRMREGRQVERARRALARCVNEGHTAEED